MLAWLKGKGSEWLLSRGRRISRHPISQYLADFAIDCVFDVGANVGQYAKEIRRLGYRQRIESFEPLPKAFADLEKAAAGDALWHSHPYALGASAASRPINVSAHSPSSSFLEMDESAVKPPREFGTVHQTVVEVKRLDDVFPSVRGQSRRTFLKIDTQGFEKDVLEGGVQSLPEFAVVQMELSLVPNYCGESLIEELIGFMRSHAFDPWWIIDGFRNLKTLQLYQADVIFVNRRHCASHQRR